ncbi:hypothetical protein CRE_07923 [Caenorhabditis remanei]|uniref:SUN domain-containing protein n=1 Tax=Caenorhabditis remanei TaxID=31234 RepID=E3NQ37_CAERE|nr:hypothetical protein CRE_07923 [Caenorhabditis remanei]
MDNKPKEQTNLVGESMSSINISMNKGRFSPNKANSSNGLWSQWIRYQLKHYMILEGLFLISILFLLINSYNVSTQNHQTNEMISKLQNRVEILEKQLNISTNSEAFNEIYSEKKEEKPIETKVVIEDIEEPETANESISVQENLSTSTHIPVISNDSVPFNAADIILGASIDYDQSSQVISTREGFLGDVENFFGTVQSDYVLLDRDELPLNKAWCSLEKYPILTVNLAKSIRLNSVSYQHSKWNGTIPVDAPKLYEIMVSCLACLNSNCEKWELVASNCEYKMTDEENQEQNCTIVEKFNWYPINKIRIRFVENQGNVNKTCAYLIRVYGEPIEYEKEEKKEKEEDSKRQMSDEERQIKQLEKIMNEKKKKKEKEDAILQHCTQLKWFHDNARVLYNAKTEKNCVPLYSKNCCSVCPECCLECEMSLGLYNTLLALSILFGPTLIIIGLYFVLRSFQYM